MSSPKRLKTSSLSDNKLIDPFCLHFDNSDLEDLLTTENSTKNLSTKIIDLKELGKCKYEFNDRINDKLNNNNLTNDNDDKFNIDNLHIKQRLKPESNELTELQKSILNLICNYKDFQFNECTNDNRQQIMESYCLHALNHILKTRARVTNNNLRIKKDPDLEFGKDQGFTRPKVLIILPFRNSAYIVINYLIKLFKGNRQLNLFDKEFKKPDKKIEKKKQKDESESEDDDNENDQLDDDYLLEEKLDDKDELIKEDEEEGEKENNDEVEEEKDNISNQKLTIMNLKKFKKEFFRESNVAFKKPDDHKQIFDGNTNEYFRIGIEFTKKSLKLYSRFYQSDIIIASPLGLRTILGAEGEKKRDYDFLSSIELLIMDQTELFLMQNWEHVIHLMKNINLQPKDHHNTDFSRIKLWYLDGLSKYYRQTLIFSSIKSIYITSLFTKESFNYEGRLQQLNFQFNLKSINPILFKQIQLKTIEHRFQRFSSNGSLSDSSDIRFKFFTETILTKLNSSSIEISFTQICEHTEKGKMAQSRKRFFTNQRKFLLYTERAHFYNRFQIKGIQHLIFYQLPTFPKYYNELSNLLIEQNQRKDFINDGKTFNCTSIYDQFDKLLLLQILGSQKTNELFNSFTSLSIL